ncbi:MAG: amidohydrolase family protein, partial [Acidimicrobiia bacterium]|nr:amidohydrolase family protein [Acidimicrobiia bacterium]
MLDVLIEGGTLVDGTGAAPRRADVGVRDGRVVLDRAALRAEEPRQRIDAGGLVVAPGFVDVHTHYDAQIMWDPAALPSPLHGVTTVIGGNCGFTLAPLGDDHDASDWLARMFARVEGVPLDALRAGVDWAWHDFGSWLARAGAGLGVNAGFLVGHSALRRSVMGADAARREATGAEVSHMCRLLHGALASGGLGLSTSQAPTHHDGSGEPVPSRAAGHDELIALASCLRDHDGTGIEIVLAGCLSRLSGDEADLMADMSVAAGRTVNWNVLAVSADRPEVHRHQLEASRRGAARGASVVALTLPYPMRVRLSFLTGAILEGLPGWGGIFGLDVDERIALLSDRGRRRELADAARSPAAGMLGVLARWDRLTIAETFAAANDGLARRTVGDIAAERGVDAFDALCDVVVADGLRTGLVPPRHGESDADWALRVEVMRGGGVVVGGSDAGAHLDMMCGAVYTTTLLAEAVRERALMPVEEAVHLLSDVPARLCGLVGRGRLVDGADADVVVFDLDGAAPEPERTVADLPGGAARLYAGAVGIPHVLVGGVAVVTDGVPT